ncbi:MAG: Brp/Blh family beta-carotene 15,15'-dioxygenase [Bacteroidota bacterium]
MTYAPPVSAGRTVRPAVWLGWLSVPTLVLAAALGLRTEGAWLYAPFIVSIVLFGLPHGAVDHLVLLRLDGSPLRLRPLVRVLAVYLAPGLAYLAFWFVAPVAAFVFFIAMTWFHWGQGDVHSLLVLTGGRHLRARWQRGLALVVRGGMPMLVPLLAFPETYLGVAQSVVGAILGDGAVASSVSPAVRLGAGAGFGLLVALHLAAGWAASTPATRRDWIVDAAETVMLAVFFATVHPLLAVGVYFCLWHAVRHLVRIALTASEAPPPVRVSGTGYLAHGVVMTVLALGLLAGLYLLVPVTPDSVGDLVGLYLLLISTLTLPHVWVVVRMDAEEGVFRRGG